VIPFDALVFAALVVFVAPVMPYLLATRLALFRSIAALRTLHLKMLIRR
jgi:hypothetical protein